MGHRWMLQRWPWRSYSSSPDINARELMRNTRASIRKYHTTNRLFVQAKRIISDL